MSKEFKLKQNSFGLLYYKYKDSSYFTGLIIAFVFGVCLMLISQVVMPQLDEWFSIRDEAIRTRERIDAINENIDFMSKVDRATLDKQVKTATNALPTDKNFGTIVTALSESAAVSGVTLDDYTFQVGKVSSIAGELKVFGRSEFAIVKITMIVKGSFEALNVFLKEIQQKLPLAEVILIDRDNFGTTVTMQFFQKPFPVITFKDDQPIHAISSKNTALLEKLSSWESVSPPDEIASSSADVPLF